MNWMRAAAILVVMAVVFPVTESAGNQDSPAVAAARRLIGDYQVIPGERIGTVRLGESTRDNFRTHYGLTFTFGYIPGADIEWNRPERNFGRGPTVLWDYPGFLIFCRSNGRLMATTVSYKPSWVYAPDRGLLNLFVQRLVTPEGVRGGTHFYVGARSTGNQ